jgi:hypothetical protein
LPVPLGLVHLLELRAAVNAYVVHQHIETTELSRRGGNRRLHRCPVGDVAWHGDDVAAASEFGSRLLGDVGVEIADCYGRAFIEQTSHRRPADTTCSTRDECDSASESLHAALSFPSCSTPDRAGSTARFWVIVAGFRGRSTARIRRRSPSYSENPATITEVGLAVSTGVVWTPVTPTAARLGANVRAPA